MAVFKSLFLGAAFALVVISLVANAQECSNELSNLSSCAAFVLPGANQGPPSNECCTALRTVDRGCACNTLSIISRLPSTCNLPPVNCPALP